tara:strand:- start:665 stop:799 length:135 start_codon:yes stop_codon:yes gene_type:complete
MFGAKGLYFLQFSAYFELGRCFLTHMVETVIPQALKFAISAEER